MVSLPPAFCCHINISVSLSLWHFSNVSKTRLPFHQWYRKLMVVRYAIMLTLYSYATYIYHTQWIGRFRNNPFNPIVLLSFSSFSRSYSSFCQNMISLVIHVILFRSIYFPCLFLCLFFRSPLSPRFGFVHFSECDCHFPCRKKCNFKRIQSCTDCA